MNGYNVYSIYQSLKLHFTTEKYNYFIYEGRTRVSEDSFNNRKDKYFFHKLARKLHDDDVVNFMVSNFIQNDKLWVRDLLDPQAELNYTKWKKRMESLSYDFENELTMLLQEGKIDDLFSVQNGEHPIALKKYLQGKLSLETMVILNNLLGYINRWNKEITETIIYPQVARRVCKYGSFLTVDIKKMKGIAKKALLSA